MKYTVSMKVEGRIYIEVEANSTGEAFEKANDEFETADLAKMEYVDSCPVNCTDENGDITDYNG